MYRDNKCTVWCQCGNCTHNYSQGTEDAEDLLKVCPKGAQRRSKPKQWLHATTNKGKNLYRWIQT